MHTERKLYFNKMHYAALLYAALLVIALIQHTMTPHRPWTQLNSRDRNRSESKYRIGAVPQLVSNGLLV